MLLLVGLGNPGSDYTNTRHNIGFKIIDAINLHFKLSKQKPKFKVRINCIDYFKTNVMSCISIAGTRIS